MAPTQQDRALAFRALHDPAAPLRLLNAWDAGSAKVLAAAGAPALGTTSAGIAFALGRPDGEDLTRDAMLAAVGVIAGAASVPVSADLEAGYDDAGATVALALAAGAVGFNLEDGRADGTLTALEEQVARVRAARAAIDASAVPAAFLNARTDTLWLGTDPDRDATAARIRAYAEAGADGLFVPGLEDPGLIPHLVAIAHDAGATLNVLATPGLPPVSDLATLGVARVSTGSGLARAALSALHAAATELLADGTYGAATAGSLSWAEVNAMMAR
jgi:2-methylisocitrate lyase-like PEP mutase family enzyme